MKLLEIKKSQERLILSPNSNHGKSVVEFGNVIIKIIYKHTHTRNTCTIYLTCTEGRWVRAYALTCSESFQQFVYKQLGNEAGSLWWWLRNSDDKEGRGRGREREVWFTEEIMVMGHSNVEIK